MLDKVHYDHYNDRFGKDGVHDAIDWDQYKVCIVSSDICIAKCYDVIYNQNPFHDFYYLRNCFYYFIFFKDFINATRQTNPKYFLMFNFQIC